MIACGLNVIRHDRLAMHDRQIVVNSFIPPLNSEAFYNIAMQVPGEGKKFFENHINGVRKAPISTYIAVTDKCMYRCGHCSAYRFMKDAKAGSEFDTGQLIGIVRQLQALGVGIIGFTGGEPLLRKDLETVVASVGPSCVSFVFTTGYGLSLERARALKKAGLFGIAVSLDSPDAEKHDAFRQYEGAFDTAVEAIKNAKQAGLYTMSQTVATAEALHDGEIRELALYLKSLHIDEMRIMEPLPCGRLEGKSESVLTDEETEQLKRLHILFNGNRKYPKTSVFPYFESEDQFGCGAGTQHSFVDAGGNFGPCDFIGKSYGNLLREDVFEVWNRIHSAAGKPRCHCLAKKHGDAGCLPKFYRLMGGIRS